MIQFVVVRHATAEHGGLELVDHQRRLSARGLREADQMAKRVLRSGVRSEVVLTSTAARATATAAPFATAFGADLIEIADLYAASGRAILALARAHGAAELTVVSHDPGVSELVSELSGDEVAMTTGAVAVFTWNDGDWDDVGVLPPDDVGLSTPV
ncbi:SixA phosphatase family protein [Microbacterium sp. P06]|uniref:SixA phosphatase family protein n=1 Tax=Microbacterium sp. P06 TaxID=3366949 RepID=UPI003745EBA2